jgi:hypothetical protein
MGLIPSLAISQTQKQRKYFPYVDHLSPKQQQQDDRNHNCALTKKHSVKKLRSFYPFNIAHSVAIVSFEAGSSFYDSLPQIGGRIMQSRIKETRTLNRNQIDSLSAIFYNVTYQGKIITLWGTGCYEPRNAVLFLDSNNHLLEYIELCFECQNQRYSSDKVNIGDLCDQKSDMVKQFFRSHGIKNGTAETTNSLDK